MTDDDVTFLELGAGAEPFLLLHGGAGPRSMLPFAGLLAASRDARVIVPTHPGFAGTPRPAGLTTVAGLAALYAGLLDRLDVGAVTVLGNSIGGWVAAELALLRSPRVDRVVLVNAVGLDVPEHPVTDVSGLTPAGLAALSFHDPARFPPDPDRPKPDLAALAAYTRMSMTDPGLRDRLAAVDLPVHVVWGESDGIAPPDYGRAYAKAIPGARFTLLPGAGHLPQLEAPDRLLAAVA
ncbi:alpha/beta fold hydrolase [Dactylosporangium sp. NPDC006015]|uniref:alpha/beta fold hydrolase n=1 Tax=Dactylosporangium sp. NPDC006015 TaxID=3154576 RepID=UPI0033B791A9